MILVRGGRGTRMATRATREALAQRLRSAREPRCVCGHHHLGELDCPAWECPCQVERNDRYWIPVISTPAYSFTAS
jgi:hypothetical protein